MVKLLGTRADDILEGGVGNDTILLRWGDDVADGGDGADNFILDGRYVDDGDRYRVRDLDFDEGDTLTFRLFDSDTFSDTVDPNNHLQILGTSLNGAIFDSVDDIIEAHNSGALIATKGGDDSTVLHLNVGGDDIAVILRGVSFDDLNILSPDLSPTDDVVVGTAFDDDMRGWGGNDELLMRFGNDTGNGGAGSDQFVFDGRYLNDGDSHIVQDLNFAEGDTLVFRFMDAGSFDDSLDAGNDLAVSNGGANAIFDSVEDILEADKNGVLTAADNGFGSTDLSIVAGGNALTITLDGWDIV
jgi:hypothetical protein